MPVNWDVSSPTDNPPSQPVKSTLETCCEYRETDDSRALRQKLADERKAMRQFETLPSGRPSKRDRRRIIQFRGRG